MTPETMDENIDYRFLLANERTFLAWIRTALGIVAGGVALDQFVEIQSDPGAVRIVAIATIILGAIVAVTGTVRWARADTLMRQRRPMERSGVVLVLGACVTLLAVVVAVLIGTR